MLCPRPGSLLNPVRRCVEKTGEMPEKSERIRVRISDDGLEAWVSLGAGGPASRKAVLGAIAAAGVTSEMDPQVLDELAEAASSPAASADERCVARGRAAVPGTPPKLELEVPAGLQPGTDREDESFDYRERKLIVPVDAGDVLGRIAAGKPGEAGETVRGETIDAEMPEAPEIAHGDGVEIDAEGDLRAARSGARFIDPKGLVDVVEAFVHPGVVDLSSGHLVTRGSLTIGRDVQSGMRARAGGDLVVGGTVEDARIEAKGSIEVKGGVVGQSQGSLRAGGDIAIRHAQGARLFAKGCVRVARGVSTSRLAASEIEISGRMLGQEARAELRISVQDAGSPAGGPCHLRAAYPIEPADIDPSRKPARIIVGGIGCRSLAGRKSNQARRSRGARGGGGEALRIRERLRWRKRVRDLQQSASIEIHGRAHVGCQISIGSATLRLDYPLDKRRVRYDRSKDALVAEEL